MTKSPVMKRSLSPKRQKPTGGTKNKSAAEPPQAISLRERNKIEKDRLIREAARKLFVQKGYDATTLREVAAEADVGFGTVFSYAVDKAGLLAMVFVEELETMPPLFKGVPKGGSLLDQLIGAFGRLYRFWADIPSLSQHVLQQMEFFGRNPHVAAIVDRRRHARMEVRDWLATQQAAGKVADDIDIEEAADTLFAIYTSCVREWSVTSPSDAAAGVARLRSLMILPIRGLEARR